MRQLALAALLGSTAILATHTFAHGAKKTSEGVVSLDVYDHNGIIDILYVDKNPQVQFVHQRSTDGGKSWGPKNQVKIAPYFVKTYNRIADPQIAALGSDLVIAWTTAKKDGKAGPLQSAFSTNAGKTWTLGTNPADDKSESGHEFVDLTFTQDKTVHAVWLDNRSGAQGVYSAASQDLGKSWQKNITVDSSSCECCWNRIYSFNSNDVFTVYRDKQPRDMVVSSKTKATTNWERSGTIAKFGWEATHCPEAGAALAITKEPQQTMHGLVWTGKDKATGVYYAQAQSIDAKMWNEPKLLDAEGKHLDMTANGNKILGVWDREGKDRVIVASLSNDAGKTWSKLDIISQPKVKAMQPRVAISGDGFLVVWTERKTNQPATLAMKKFP